MNLLLWLLPLCVVSTDPTTIAQPSEPELPTVIQEKIPDSLSAFGIPGHMWRCGSGEYITSQVIRVINNTCPLAAVEFNHCCAVHDDCYSNRRGQDICDEQFCGCLEYQAKNNPEAGKCGPMAKLACNGVKTYGQAAYENSLGHSEVNPEEKWIPEEIPHISRDFEKVYDACKTQTATIGSCALNSDMCYRNPSILPKQACVLNLIRCLDSTRQDRNPDENCDVAIEEVLWKLVSTKEQKPENSDGESGDLNILAMQGVLKNQTFVKKIYLQIVHATSSFSWIVYFCIVFSCILCSVILLIAALRNGENEDYGRRRRYDDDVINVRVTSTSSGVDSKKTSTTSEASEMSKKSPSSKK
ncbi:hypothetical protein B9Z55_015879 [Caenorhabditis nigoni]|uniref:Phospholipase A2 domain-containing protein n=1 Tax=Caenorhabditis nigoni TaxID=1611254 RepID=A0A2G5UD20_9PELO|nr:hypothetical protein B9Z55_015879 [Caenorhabditis nigoni]